MLKYICEGGGNIQSARYLVDVLRVSVGLFTVVGTLRPSYIQRET